LPHLCLARDTTRDEQDAARTQQRHPEFSHHREWAKRAGGCDIEALTVGAAAEVLQACVHYSHVLERKTLGGGFHPVRASALSIHERKPRCRVRRRERQPGKTSAGAEIDPFLVGKWSPNARQAKSILKVSLPQSLALAGTKEPSLHSFEICPLKLSQQDLCPFVTHPGSLEPLPALGGLCSGSSKAIRSYKESIVPDSSLYGT
jgi:hypothetical protein